MPVDSNEGHSTEGSLKERGVRLTRQRQMLLKQEHAHVICLRCGKVEEFFGEPLQRLRKQIETHFGFQVLLARTEVGGYCQHCQTLRAREVEELRSQPVTPTKRAAVAKRARS